MALATASPGTVKLMGSPYNSKFATEGDVKRFEEMVSSSPRKEQSFLAVGSGYLAVGAYAQAEQALLKATFADPNDVEAKLKLAEAYKQQKKYIQAAEIFEGLLSSQPSNREYAFSAARLRLIIAKGKTGLESANHTCIGIRSLKKTRPAGNNQFSSSALDILMNIYQTVYTSGIPLEHDLLAETVYISSLEETLSNPALHRFIFQSLLASDSTIFQAMYYYEARRIPFRTDLEWNLIAYRNINRMAPAAIKLNDLKASSQPTSATTRKAVIDAGRRFKLNVSYEVANLQLKEGHGTWIESEIISAYETETEDLDSIMPDSDPDVSLWSKVRQEHVARLELLLALKSLKQLEPYGIDVMAVRSENRPSIFGSILKSLAACLSFRPLPDPFNGLTKESIADRLSRASHAALAIVSCYTKSFLCSSYTKKPTSSISPSKSSITPIPEPRHSEAGLAADIWVKLPFLSEDPVLALAVKNGEGWPMGLVKGLRWVLKKDEEDGKRTSKMKNKTESADIHKTGHAEADEISFLESPWDLERIVTIAAWHFQQGVLRQWLRKLFDRMAERPISYPTLSDRSVPRIPTPTVADMEAFLIILISQRIHSLILKKMAVSSGDVLYLSALRCWRATDTQRAFWVKALASYSKCPMFVTSFAPLPDKAFTQGLLEIRGCIRPPARCYRMVFAHVGIEFANLAIAARTAAHSMASLPQDVHSVKNKTTPNSKTPFGQFNRGLAQSAGVFVEAMHYLTVMNEWSSTKGVATFIKPEALERLVVLEEFNMAEYDGLYSPIEEEAEKLLIRLQKLFQANPARSDNTLQGADQSPSSRQRQLSTPHDPSSSDISLIGNISPATSPSAKSVRSAFSRGSFSETGGAGIMVKVEQGDEDAEQAPPRKGSDSDDGWVKEGYEDLTTGSLKKSIKVIVEKNETKAELVEEDMAPPITLLDEITTATVEELQQERTEEKRRRIDALKQAATPKTVRRYASLDTLRSGPADWDIVSKEPTEVGLESEDSDEADEFKSMDVVRPNRLMRQLGLLMALNPASPLKGLETVLSNRTL